MQIELQIESNTIQGMTIERMVLVLIKTNCNIKIWVSEMGFDDLWMYRVFITPSGFIWDHGHFWLKHFFDDDVEKMLSERVQQYHYFFNS